MGRSRALRPIIALGLLTLAGMISVYCLAFSVWMTAYPFADLHLWRVRFYIWAAASVLIGACWVATLIWLLRRKQSGPQPPQRP